ncbi:uncharacterized protein LOC115777766 isoform X2 [Archocentrus centrarchus]|uniref:uncharacterized protein LOC115777766 isoform X2 n=1 Tax=Archocentrus centrarchus TaxID=63155 RepID=UPI0011E9C047|nr:uncharacterized protein LOC115777766 isoform X2 [Archocentrus centrarchus]
MLSRPLTLNESDDRRRSLVAVTPPHVLPLDEDDDDTQTAPPHPPPPILAPPPPSASALPYAPSFPPITHSVSPPLATPPPLPPPCCPCASLLPRLLSAHRMEVRRLLRGALASLSRRLNSLEKSRRKRKKKMSSQKEKEGCSHGSPVFGSSSTSSFSCSPPPLPSLTLSTSSSSSSSSSDSEQLPSPPLSSSSSQSQQRKRRRREKEMVNRRKKRRRKNHRGDFSISPENKEEDEGEGRFVGRMAVCVRGGSKEEEEEEPLTLYNFSPRKNRRTKEGDSSQSKKAISVFVRKNGYGALPAPLLDSFSHHALHHLQSAESLTSSQSGVFTVSSVSPAPMLHLPAATVEMVLDSVKGGACWSPLRPLKDWTAPPSLSSDHCYVRTLTSSPVLSARQQQKQRSSHSTRSLYLPQRRPLPLPACSANGLPTLLPAGQSAVSSRFLSTNGEHGKRVSQIRIRRASPREMLLTPMGLPKVKRLKKKEFSLEEIYTNKNYKSPANNRSLETIFEEPREKDGALLLIGHQKRRRLLLFPDFTQPRKRKRPQGAGLPVTTVPRKRSAARRHCHSNGGDDADLDVMLVERLSALEDFLTRQGLDV